MTPQGNNQILKVVFQGQMGKSLQKVYAMEAGTRDSSILKKKKKSIIHAMSKMHKNQLS